MKKMMKRIVKLLPAVMLVMGVVLSSVYAANTNINIPNTISGTASNKITTAAGNTWATVVTIVQILAVAAIVFAGVRYMFASADQKADIKKSLGTLAIGAILVFCAASVLKFIQGAAEEVI